MSKRAEKLALEAYPQVWNEEKDCDVNYEGRCGFTEGYKQAEKYLGWQSAKDSKPNPSEWVVVCIEDHGTPQCLSLATYNEELDKWFTDFEDGEQEEYHPDYWLRIPEFQYK